ncbi:alpha/beta hydrolase [Streptomyces sp. SID8352]|uniref:alpha/beta fold hydrolase n=1 Tax=Streptomyces sp. SID8352 TaxID=2690338 RepID=UPI00136BCE4B|nr:alpha/beta hydrolase [Streptomyces sp. SID8352]MYU21142.1 alpha/beta fold hydrolase [Streptomyces sp. SID8352]
MQLHRHEWGSGDRVAVLIHGIMSDHRTWHRVGPALAGHGYRVIAVDLRGHGRSPRGEYGAEIFAQDLIDTLPSGTALAIGHSLGGLALSLAVERLRPQRAVYSDPLWHFGAGDNAPDPALFTVFRHATTRMIKVFNPRWEHADAELEAAALRLWDVGTASALSSERERWGPPRSPAVPSLVQAAGQGFLLTQQQKTSLVECGFTVRTVEGAGHTIHRDNFEGFMESLTGWC